MSEDLAREVRILEVRLDGFVKAEEDFVKGLRRCVEKFKEVVDVLQRRDARTDAEQVKEFMARRLDAIQALREALQRASTAEHEKSHILESYGAVILALEEQMHRVS